MKLNKFEQKSILITSLFLTLVVSIVAFLNQKTITNIYENSNPSQEKTDSRCKNFDKVTKEFEKYFFSDNLVNINESKIDQDSFIRTIKDKPLLNFPALKYISHELEEKQINSLMVDYEKNIKPKILKVGLVPEFTYQNFNSIYIQYSQFGSKYLIELPSNAKSDITSRTISISCTELNESLLSIYNNVLNDYKEYNFIKFESLSDKALLLTVNDSNSISGYRVIYDLSGQKPEIIYRGQEEINCQILENRKIGNGLSCFK